MTQDVLYEVEFVLLILLSIVIPAGIYTFLIRKVSISRWTVGSFAIVLLAVAGLNVILLQHLSHLARSTGSLISDKLFSGQVSLALYLFPLLFGGLGVNLLSHMLVNHLDDAEAAFDHGRANTPRTESVPRMEGCSQASVLAGSTLGTALIFALDVLSGAEIRLHVLYVFPLAAVAMYCPGLGAALVALLVTTLLQIITFSHQALRLPAFATDIGVAATASSLVVFLARIARKRYLAALNGAQTDPLTGLPNRRALLARVDWELTRQRRYGGTISLAMLDLDGFKALNDARGHHAGDEALKLVAGVLRQFTRDSDAVGRIGGDEFIVVMPNMDAEDCRRKSRELRDAIAPRMTAAGFAISASVGWKTFEAPPDSTAQALQAVDELMYQAKERGSSRRQA
jgi:diguanylate cyclase (GGDEF)-like protein